MPEQLLSSNDEFIILVLILSTALLTVSGYSYIKAVCLDSKFMRFNPKTIINAKIKISNPKPIIDFQII